MQQGPYHSGELEAQRLAGVTSMAAKIGRGVHGEFPPAAAAFLNQARLVVVSTTDDKGRPWASILTGEPGFVRTPNPFTAVISARPAAGDPLAEHLIPGHQIGLLAPDFATRRRMRLNGTIERGQPGEIVIRAEQVYGNCPKYIQRRVPVAEPGSGSSTPALGTSLNAAERKWVRQADTFFIATANPGEGADASHRGGQPGFIHVKGDRLRWPDYSGNMMFNSIGNILSHPWAGIAIPDFANGGVLMLSGAATIDWSPSQAEVEAGAERVIQLDVDRVVELAGVLPFRAEWVEPSPFNPGLRQTR